MSTSPKKSIPYDRPAIYRISVQGRIDLTWSDRLEGMSISQVKDSTGLPVTILEGELGDQAALAGVLNTLYELHLTVLLVKRLDDGLPANPVQVQIGTETEP